MSHTNRIGEIETSYRYLQPAGPKSIHGDVTLRFDFGKPYAFMSVAAWPSGEIYETAVREAIEEELRACQGALDRAHVTLVRIAWDEVSSCELGFRRAAAAATRAAFER